MSDKIAKRMEILKAKAMLDNKKAEARLETTRAKCKRIRDRVNGTSVILSCPIAALMIISLANSMPELLQCIFS